MDGVQSDSAPSVVFNSLPVCTAVAESGRRWALELGSTVADKLQHYNAAQKTHPMILSEPGTFLIVCILMKPNTRDFTRRFNKTFRLALKSPNISFAARSSEAGR